MKRLLSVIGVAVDDGGKMRTGRPTVEDILEQAQKCERIYSGLWDKFEEDEKFYECDFKERLNIPNEFADDRIVLPTARDVVDVAINHTDIHNARVFANKKGISERAIEAAEMLRKLGLGIIHQTNVESQIAPGHVSSKHFWIHGLGVLKTIWDVDRWPDKPLQKEGEPEKDYAERLDEWRFETHRSIPIIIQAINPANIMPDPHYGGNLYIFERHKKLLFDAKRLWPHWDNPKGKHIEDAEVEYISYWDKDYRCDLVDGEPILKVKGGVGKHGYGFIPYTLIESGLGNLSKDALPEKRYVGLLRYIFDLLISESTNYSMCDILMKRETMKGGYITGIDAEGLPEVRQEYGKYWPIGNKDVQFHDWETKLASREAYAHLALTHDLISEHAAPSSVRGLPAEGVRSAAHMRLMETAGAAIYQYGTPAFAYGWANVLSKCAMLVKNVIPGDFEIWTKTPSDEFDVVIKKELLKEPFSFQVEFAPISEEDEYRRHDDLERLVQTKIITIPWARRQMSNVDPIAMEREEQKEQLRNAPEYIQVKTQYLVGKLAGAISQRQAAEGIVTGGEPMTPEMPGAQTGMPPPGQTPLMGGMVPPIRQVAPPGSAQEIQNRLKQLRSQTSMAPMQGVGGGGARV